MAGTQEIKPIEVNGIKFPMHSEYFFDLKKTYKESPARAIDGSINSFPKKFFVPYFKIKYSLLKMEDYQQMMSLLQGDEQSVKFYDSFAREYRTAKFYCQQPTYNKLYGMKGDYYYIIDLELIFSGTLNNETAGTVAFNMNGITGTAPDTISGNVGDNFTMPTVSGVASWNTASDGSGVKYISGGTYAITIPSMTLYAMEA